MESRNRTSAYFSLKGSDFDPAEITKRLGVEPTMCWRKGDPHPAVAGVHRKSDRWSLKSRLPDSASLETHTADVLDQMDEHREAFFDLMREYDGELQLVGYFELDYPGFRLPPSATERIGFYKLSLDCDFYYLYSNQREDTDKHS
jgi:hypothetical protein